MKIHTDKKVEELGNIKAVIGKFKSGPGTDRITTAEE